MERNNAEVSPPRPPYYTNEEPDSFPSVTASQRWPVIFKGIVEDLKFYMEGHDLAEEKKREGEEIALKIESLLKELQEDAKLIEIPNDSGSDWKVWNDAISRYWKGKSWRSASWLFVECYMYRRIRSIFLSSNFWKDFDPFERKKLDSFYENRKQVESLAESFGKPSLEMKEEEKKMVFHELAQFCLWGNSHDLSLLALAQHSKETRSVLESRSNLLEQEKLIIVNHLDQIWDSLSKKKGVRMDFIDDNAGYEQFVDLVFADWLVQSGYASNIVFHLKEYPWFVSDTLPKDFDFLIKFCTQDGFGNENLKLMGNRWKGHLESGIWKVQTHIFWTTGFSFWHLPTEAPDLHSDLKNSSFLFFKGDLNFRKLTYDCKWESTVTFAESIGPLATDFPPLVVFRTNKADVFVGMNDKQREKQLDAEDPKWRFSGKYGVVLFSKGN